MAPVTFRLFVYGTFLPEESEHDVIAGAKLVGSARTKSGYALVELNAFAGLLKKSGQGQVHGEIYEIEYDRLAACDKRRDHPNRYHRDTIELDDGTEAHSYLLHADQARGLRRVKGGDWRARFKRDRPTAGPFVNWAKGRYRTRD